LAEKFGHENNLDSATKQKLVGMLEKQMADVLPRIDEE
jgi:hypothetical protein